MHRHRFDAASSRISASVGSAGAGRLPLGQIGLGQHQEPRRAETALQPVMVAERLLQVGQLLAVGQALDRADVDPSACTPNIRQDRAGEPSTSTVHAPQMPCSQPRCVPV